MVAPPVYVSIADHIASLLFCAGLDSHEVEEIAYVGGPCRSEEHAELGGVLCQKEEGGGDDRHA
ncbi:hypothetical protein H1R20_g13699, partial [Candolleomyces eurysporus]